MTTRVQKWGNSLGVRLPKEIANKFKLRVGSSVAVEAGPASIHIKPTPEKTVKLAELIKTISARNRHTVTDWGSQVGNEIW